MNPNQVSAIPLTAIEQHPKDLILGILRCEAPIALTVLAKQAVTLAKWRIDFRIIGESHWITVRCNNEDIEPQIWHELLACVGLDTSKCAYAHRFSDMQEHAYHYEDKSLRVVGKIWFEAYRAHQLPTLRGMQLDMAFPQVHGQTPITRVGWEILTAHRLNWWTFHLYPNASGALGVHSYTELWL